MKIETKYSPNDTVMFVQTHQIVSGTITGIKVMSTPTGFYTSYYLEGYREAIPEAMVSDSIDEVVELEVASQENVLKRSIATLEQTISEHRESISTIRETVIQRIKPAKSKSK